MSPVYSEITDESAPDPVYTDIDRQEPRPQAYVNVHGPRAAAPYEVPLPM